MKKKYIYSYRETHLHLSGRLKLNIDHQNPAGPQTPTTSRFISFREFYLEHFQTCNTLYATFIKKMK